MIGKDPYESLICEVTPCDIVLFESNDIISEIIFNTTKQHMGVVVNKEIAPKLNLGEDKLYVIECIRVNNNYELQLRELELIKLLHRLRNINATIGKINNNPYNYNLELVLDRLGVLLTKYLQKQSWFFFTTEKKLNKHYYYGYEILTTLDITDKSKKIYCNKFTIDFYSSLFGSVPNLSVLYDVEIPL